MLRKVRGALSAVSTARVPPWRRMAPVVDGVHRVKGVLLCFGRHRRMLTVVCGRRIAVSGSAISICALRPVLASLHAATQPYEPADPRFG